MKIGKAKPKGVAGVTPARKTGDKEKPVGYPGNGRPTNYRPEYCQAIVDYFAHPISWVINTDAKGSSKVIPSSKIPTIARWCHSIGVSTRVLDDWQRRHPEFAEAYQMARELQQAFVLELGAAGLGSGLMTAFMQVKHDWRVDKEAEEDNKPLEIRIVKAVKPEAE